MVQHKEYLNVLSDFLKLERKNKNQDLKNTE